MLTGYKALSLPYPMAIIIILCAILTASYLLLILAYMKGWARQPEFKVPQGYVPQTFISIIIPARNEKDNIGACIDAILAQKYPAHLLEVIVVDDHSEDRTKDIVLGYNDERVRCIALASYISPGTKINAYKKAALAAGIKESKGSLIVTTDADCSAPNLWLLHIATLYEQRQPAMIVAPVIFSGHRGVLKKFQLIDFMGMQGITAATHSMKMGNMSNGANLAFSKAIFNEVNGYEGVEHLASGDDYLLMMKIARLPHARIEYLKSPNAIVATLPQPTWGSFLQQRIRWASKSGKYDDKKLTAVLMLVYLFNVAIVALGVAGFVHHSYWLIAGGMLALKTITEYIYMVPVSIFFRKQWAQAYFPLLQPLHIVYITLAGFLGFIGNYKWKDRKVK